MFGPGKYALANSLDVPIPQMLMDPYCQINDKLKTNFISMGQPI
jgi:hypothetical protein